MPEPTSPRAQTVAEEDGHDALAGGAERLEDADIAGFFDDDHEKDGEDAEAGDGDDEKEEDVEDGGLHANGREDGPVVCPRQV